MTRFARSPAVRRVRRAARHAVDRVVLSAINGAIYLGGIAARPTMGSAPRDVVFERDKLILHRLRAPADDEFELGHEVHHLAPPRAPVPLLVIPPLMVRPYIYDLRPEHSMLRTLRNAGFDVFVVDFGVPDSEDEEVKLDDYVLDYVPVCVDQALRASGAAQIALAGYCMGGIFALMYVGTFHDARVRAIVTIGSPVNFDKMGALTVAAHLGAPGVDTLVDVLGNVPGSLSSLGFKIMSGPRTFLKYADLLRNLYDDDYVRAFDAVNTWVNDMIPYPKEAFRQMFREVVYGNKLLTNELEFGGNPCDLRRVRCPLLAFAGETDNVAPPASTREIVRVVGSADKALVPVPGGHVGVVAGSQAPRAVWRPMAEWLHARSC
jgi:polyhydroxyalkanoate synthase